MQNHSKVNSLEQLSIVITSKQALCQKLLYIKNKVYSPTYLFLLISYLYLLMLYLYFIYKQVNIGTP